MARFIAIVLDLVVGTTLCTYNLPRDDYPFGISRITQFVTLAIRLYEAKYCANM